MTMMIKGFICLRITIIKLIKNNDNNNYYDYYDYFSDYSVPMATIIIIINLIYASKYENRRQSVRILVIPYKSHVNF